MISKTIRPHPQPLSAREGSKSRRDDITQRRDSSLPLPQRTKTAVTVETWHATSLQSPEGTAYSNAGLQPCYHQNSKSTSINHKKVMNKHYFKQLSTFALGLFFTAAAPVFGQITDDPIDKKIVYDTDKILFEHGYNKTHTSSKDAPREDRDSVTVTSTMNYFVMPDKYFNPLYFGQSDYKATGSTKSKFDWALAASSTATATIAPVNPNTSTTPGTSPWITATWNTTGDATLTMKEIPQGMTSVCEGEETTIPVTVISKPVIKFIPQGDLNDVFELAKCAPMSGATLNAEVEYPIEVKTESDQVLIDYSIVFTPLEGPAEAVKTETNFKITKISETVSAGITTITGALTLKMTEYGSYEIVITKITDRIARKCNVTGEIAANAGDVLATFKYVVLPQPSAGKTYHVPNNF